MSSATLPGTPAAATAEMRCASKAPCALREEEQEGQGGAAMERRETEETPCRHRRLLAWWVMMFETSARTDSSMLWFVFADVSNHLRDGGGGGTRR